ncbi:MAG TPA: hypothetical protein VG759_13065, partial [Candidatus Angelobacter sp.]|nr:hypothetical protein [Candidatus Angelobacter sp.]
FSQAIAIRPDRADLLAARAALEERLLRFDDAATDYSTLYERTYHDAQWMERLAEIRARQSRPELTVQALKTAFIENRPEAAEKYLTVAEHLERWGMLSQAREFAERGIALAGKDLLAGAENHPLAELYVRIMTRLRMQDAVWRTLDSAMNVSDSLPPLPAQTGNKELNSTTEQEWRASQLRTRQQAAHDGMARCMKAMGSTISLYFTPEEKQAFLQIVQDRNSASSRDDAYDYLIPLAKAAGFTDLQAKLMYENVMNRPDNSTHLSELIDLQTRRLKLGELGQQLEHIAESYGQKYSEYFSQAADAYRLAGQPLDELRTLKRLEHYSAWNWMNRQQTHLFELLLKYEPQELLARAQRNDKPGDASADFIVAHADMKMVRAALKARSAQEDPVWRQAYTGLAGLYFKDTSPEIRTAFLQALSNESIGQRIRHHGDRSEEMAGDVWFYYGSRYGEYLELTHQGDPEDWLPAELEHTPGRSSAYFDSAVHCEDIGDLPHAIDDFNHVLELSPKRGDAHDHLGEIYWGQGRKEEALAEWAKALEALKNQATASRGEMPESFSEDYSNIADHLKAHHLLPQFRAQLNGLLHIYVQRSDAFGLQSMLQSSLSDANNAGEATALVLELSRDAHDQLNFLASFVEAHSKLPMQMEPLYRRILELAQQTRIKEATFDSRYTLRDWQIKWFEFLLTTRQYPKLRAEIDSVKKVQKSLFNRKKAAIDEEYESDEDEFENNLTRIQLRLAAATNTLSSYMESLNDSEHPPSSKLLKATARALQQAGDRQSARRILEFVFRRELENHNLNASNMLALAEIRIEDGEVQPAVELMRRMTLVAGAPFETQEPAAALLMRTGHPHEAISFLKELADAAPWNPGYRSTLAQAQIDANVDLDAARKMLAVVAEDKTAPYEVRAAGAKALKQPGSALDPGSQELKLLASGRRLTTEESNHPFFFAARVQAAQNLEPAQGANLLRLALADYPQADSLRPTLLKIAMQAGDYHLAVASMKPLVENHWLDLNQYGRYSAYQNSDDEADDDDDSDATGYDMQAEGEPDDQEPPSLDKLPAQQKAEIARQIGIAFEKVDELPEAIRYLKEASHLEPSVVARKQIAQEARRIREILDQRKENSSRQPQIHDELEQSNIVRPRLVMAMPAHQRISRTIAAHGRR